MGISVFGVTLPLYIQLYIHTDYTTIPPLNREGKDQLAVWLDVMALWQRDVNLL